MKNWYQNRMSEGVRHRGFGVPQDKYLLLTDEQAKLHNKNGKEQRVAEAETAPKKEEVAVLADWDEYQNSQPTTETRPQPTTEAETATESKSKSSNRRNR